MANRMMPAPFEHMAERDEVVAHVGAGIDQRMANAGLRRQMHDAVEAAREQCGRRRAVGEVDALERKALDRTQRFDARLLERGIEYGSKLSTPVTLAPASISARAAC